MTDKEKKIIVKCINVVMTASLAKGEKSSLEKSRYFQIKYLGENLSLIEARRGLNMKNSTMIKELKSLSESSKQYLIEILSDMENNFETEKAKLYCQELTFLLSSNSDVNTYNTPNLSLSLKAEKVFSWIYYIILFTIIYFIYKYFS